MPRTGRPRAFNRDEAVITAMYLFWEYGFESTSLAQLRSAMGNISAASFYAAFESKEALFREAVEKYTSTYGQVSASFIDGNLTPREAMEEGLRRSAQMQTENSHPLGCLIVLSALTCSSENKHVHDLLAKEREKTRKMMKICVENAIKNGDLLEDTDTAVLVNVFNTFLQGISTQAKDGIPFETIDASITQIMSIWDAQSARA